MNPLFFIFSFLILVIFPPAFAEQNEILITFSDTMDEVEFDGKWTFGSEWKASSLETFGVNNIILSPIHIGELENIIGISGFGVTNIVILESSEKQLSLFMDKE